MAFQPNTLLSSVRRFDNLFLHSILGVILLFACAQVSIPLKPVPITLQTMGLMLIALRYDFKTCTSIIASYIIAGTLGFPIFADFSFGPHVILGTTGGYLLGFIPCAYIMDKFKNKLNIQSFMGILINCTLGTCVIFICGISWLSYFIGFKAAFIYGLLPFIIPGMIKAVVLTGCIKAVGMFDKN